MAVARPGSTGMSRFFFSMNIEMVSPRFVLSALI
jgi:hypothetical protein